MCSFGYCHLLDFYVKCGALYRTFISQSLIRGNSSNGPVVGRFRGVVFDEGGHVRCLPSVTWNVVVNGGWSLMRGVVNEGFYCMFIIPLTTSTQAASTRHVLNAVQPCRMLSLIPSYQSERAICYSPGVGNMFYTSVISFFNLLRNSWDNLYRVYIWFLFSLVYTRFNICCKALVVSHAFCRHTTKLYNVPQA